MLIKVKIIRRFTLFRFTSSVLSVSLFIIILFGLAIWIDQTCNIEESSVNTRLLSNFVDNSKELQRINGAKCCFWPTNNERFTDLKLLEDIVEAAIKPQSNGNGIFFHETSCSKNGIIQLNAR